jgi:hypothetical protein
LFSTASRAKLIRGLLGSTKANDHIRPRQRKPTPFSFAVVPKKGMKNPSHLFSTLTCVCVFRAVAPGVAASDIAALIVVLLRLVEPKHSG